MADLGDDRGDQEIRAYQSHFAGGSCDDRVWRNSDAKGNSETAWGEPPDRWTMDQRFPKRGWKGPFVHVMEAVSGHHGEGKFTGRCAHKPGYPKPGRPAICLVCLASNVEGLLSKMRRNGDDAIDVPDSVYAGKAKYKFKPKGKA